MRHAIPIPSELEPFRAHLQQHHPERTVRAYTTDVALFLSRGMRHYERGAIIAYLADRTARKRATAVRKLSALKQYGCWALKAGRISANPFEFITARDIEARVRETKRAEIEAAHSASSAASIDKTVPHGIFDKQEHRLEGFVQLAPDPDWTPDPAPHTESWQTTAEHDQASEPRGAL